MTFCGRTLRFDQHTLVMGVVNVTPDSFSDGGLFFDPDRAVEHGLALAAQGADILDVGGQSTRPFSDPVSEEEELARVLPVIKRLAAAGLDVPISIDTYVATVAEKALDAGASIINDITALSGDPRMAAVAAERRVPVILMHMQGTPKTMQVDPSYTDVVAEVRDFLARAMDRAVDAGISRDLLMVDPGLGFGKTVEHNMRLIKNVSALAGLGAPVVVGPSRKASIRKILQDAGIEAGADPLSRE
ncbi:MAG: dihydropteroate synthase, partial [Deltaproteobacteria bacterium]|nr:dihydropteroate synthase [Deltaproteobacteria bacterium]